MTTMFICFPAEMLESNLSVIWNKIYRKFKYEYPDAKIVSNYTSDFTVETSDSTILIFEYKNSKSYIDVIERCNQLNKTYVYVSLATI